jgi:hypothetical protein
MSAYKIEIIGYKAIQWNSKGLLLAEEIAYPCNYDTIETCPIP